MEDSKLLIFAKWVRSLFEFSTILCVVLTIMMPFIDNNTWLGKVQHWIAVVAVLLFVGIVSLSFLIKNDHDLRQPKQKKSGGEHDVENMGKIVGTKGVTPTPIPTNSKGSAGKGEPTPSDREKLFESMMIGVIDNTRQRLMLEIKYQKNTSYFNLTISIVLSAIALYVMWLYAFDTKSAVTESHSTIAGTLTWLDFAYVAIPKFGLALFIELIALSFYKTYKANLDNIKYYQNELTSIESRRIALYASLSKGSDENIKSCVDTLLKIDRNFKLADGESTIELEKLKLDYSYLSKVIKSFKGVINIKEEEK